MKQNVSITVNFTVSITVNFTLPQIEWIACDDSYGGGFDFKALNLSGVAAVLLAAFFSYYGSCNKELMKS